MHKQITIEDVPEDLYDLYEIVGSKLFNEILDRYQGEFVYIPTRKTLERKYRHESIQKEYNGHNINQLADKYGYSKRYVRNIVFKK